MRYFLEENLQSHGSIHLCYLWPSQVFSCITWGPTPWPTSCIHSVIDRHLKMCEMSLGSSQKTFGWVWQIKRRPEIPTSCRSCLVQYVAIIGFLRGHLLLCCRGNNLRLKSSDCTRKTVGISVFQRRGWCMALRWNQCFGLCRFQRC